MKLKISACFMIFVILFSSFSGTLLSAVGEDDTNIGFLMQPVVEKLASISPEEAEANAARFTDIGKHWGRSIIGRLSGLDIITGYGNGQFRPDSPVQADQFIKMVILALGHKVEPDNKYWGTPYIEIAKQLKLVLDGEFTDYALPLAREKMARIITRAALLFDSDPGDKYEQYIIGQIKDYPEILDNYKQDVINAYKLGLVTGSGGKFMPGKTLSRAEAAVVILRLLDRNERKPMQPGEDERFIVETEYWSKEVYAGAIREYFDVAKVMYEAIPKDKGFIAPAIENIVGRACMWMYIDKESSKVLYSEIAAFCINSNNEIYPYYLNIYYLTECNKLYLEYIHTVLKSIFKEEYLKAIELFDKFALSDFQKRIYETTELEKREVTIIRHSEDTLSLQIGYKTNK